MAKLQKIRKISEFAYRFYFDNGKTVDFDKFYFEGWDER